MIRANTLDSALIHRPVTPAGSIPAALSAAVYWALTRLGAGRRGDCISESLLPCAVRPRSRLYRVLMMETAGPGERIFEFEDSPSLIDLPVAAFAAALLERMVQADRPMDPLRYRVADARRHGDIVMITGALVVSRGDVEFVALASVE